MSTEFEFIVIGAGPSGCVLATRLSQAESQPTVLLIEAGGDNKNPSYLIPAERYTLVVREPSLNWGYKTEPQSHLANQSIDYSRGKGLGGSTAINFSCWLIGADEDFNEWARLVGDDAWSWTNVKERLKKIENLHPEVAVEHKQFVNPAPEDHGTSGPLDLMYAEPFEKGLTDIFVAATQVNLGTNPDVNSGNPIGLGLGPSCMYKGARTTASSYLETAGPNLTILVNSQVAQIVFSGKQAISIKTIDDREFFAKREIILSAGAINSPQLLMLSGIGPQEELEKHGIPLIHELSDVGRHLQDHAVSGLTLIQNPGTSDRSLYETSPETQLAAKEQHAKDGTGLLNSIYCSSPMGWFKDDAILASEEFKSLDTHIQEHLRKPTIPFLEIATHSPPLALGDYVLQPTDSYLTGFIFGMNPQSHGEVNLRSGNPVDPPKIQPNLASHPFDRRVLIEATRTLIKLFKAPILKKTTVKMVGCPKSNSDEDIWDHLSKNLFSSWHMCGTVRMGKESSKDACTDADFRLRGVQNLRVVDLSVVPLLPNTHTQSTAYLVGETAAEKIIAEYNL